MTQNTAQQAAPNTVPNMLPPFRLYGLIGCPHCVQAEQLFRTEGLPVLVVIGNDDPIAEAGVKAVTGKSEANFPMLVCTFGKQIVEGFKEDEYRKLFDAYRILFNSPRPSVEASGGQQSDASVETPIAPIVAGAD